MIRRSPTSPLPDRFAPAHAAGAKPELLPMLVWLNRRELASRFPAWQPDPGLPVDEAEQPPALERRDHDER